MPFDFIVADQSCHTRCGRSDAADPGSTVPEYADGTVALSAVPAGAPQAAFSRRAVFRLLVFAAVAGGIPGLLLADQLRSLVLRVSAR